MHHCLRPNNGKGPINCFDMYMDKKTTAKINPTKMKNMNAISEHWVPVEAKEFLLSISTLDYDLDIYALAKFWSRPSMRQYTVGGIAGGVCSASWFMALQYLKLGHVREARALALNGAFLHQCSVSIHIILYLSYSYTIFYSHHVSLHFSCLPIPRTCQLKISSISVALISMHQFKIMMYPSSLMDIMPYGRQKQ